MSTRLLIGSALVGAAHASGAPGPGGARDPPGQRTNDLERELDRLAHVVEDRIERDGDEPAGEHHDQAAEADLIRTRSVHVGELHEAEV